MTTESSSFSGTSSGQESMNTGGSEGSVILITKHKLTGHNYHQWAKSVMMFISGKGKDDYLTGAASPPQKDDPSFRMWKTENNMVMSWLINTMDNEIGQNFLFYDTAYEIWMAAKETYSDNDNTTELFDIKGALHDLRQGEMSGENSVSQEEYQFWDIPTLDIPQRLPQSHSQLDVESFQSDIQPLDPSLIQGGNKELKDKELKVYSRRQKNPKPVEPHMHPEPCQTDVPSPTPTEVIQGMLGCKPSDTPMDPFNKVGLKKDSAAVDKGRYQRLVGKLIYLSHTRPDISFAVSTVSQFMNNPTKEHQEAVYRILRYLKMTPGRGLFFKKGVSRGVEIFSDADWAGSLSDRRSTSGYCTYVWGNLVTWRSKKQSVVARSSAEAEFRAMAHGICEGMWLKRLLEELQFPPSASMKLMCDNKAAISIAKNPVHHDRTKHVEIDRHFIKEKIEQGVIQVDYTPTWQQTADVLTKAIPRGPFDIHLSKLGLIDIHAPA
ncbi:hypothetical protein RJ640_013552 [Escallonia rubra]|uniref:Retrotransposon Copia-like N-terminal domain-containing protein n=1 Tax=Escallonia rubra TaxID=112253 RepID=A0AA88RCM2_9ASTE|nr:hypothetical protein RJ640_013552 [Escallonia rubra]